MNAPVDESSSPAPTIAVCIVGRNEAGKLVECFESVLWADELVFVDLESDDESASIAASFGARVVRHPRVPIVELVRNVAADAAASEWVLALDPDERVEPGLARELRALSRRTDLDLIEIPFMHYDLGFPPSHPALRYDPKPRMYRRAQVRWPELPHALPRVDPARSFRLPPDDELVMRHERSANLVEILDRAARYAPAEAQSMIDRGELFTARAMTTELAWKAYRQFIQARPDRDGVPGLFRATVLVQYHFFVWLEFWRRSGVGRTAEDDRFVARFGKVASAADGALRVAARAAKAKRRLHKLRARLAPGRR